MPGCKAEIHAMTGLQEIGKIQQHFRKKHRFDLSMTAALEVRIAMEDGVPPAAELMEAMLKGEA
jgi:hypothetical protein